MTAGRILSVLRDQPQRIDLSLRPHDMDGGVAWVEAPSRSHPDCRPCAIALAYENVDSGSNVTPTAGDRDSGILRHFLAPLQPWDDPSGVADF